MPARSVRLWNDNEKCHCFATQRVIFVITVIVHCFRSRFALFCLLQFSFFFFVFCLSHLLFAPSTTVTCHSSSEQFHIFRSSVVDTRATPHKQVQATIWQNNEREVFYLFVSVFDITRGTATISLSCDWHDSEKAIPLESLVYQFKLNLFVLCSG